MTAPRRSIAAIALLGLSVAGHTEVSRQSDAARCASLNDRIFDAVALVTATAILPAAAPAPEYCRVTVRFNDSALRFNAWLPTRDWNGKLAYLGGGGFDGVLTPRASVIGSRSLLDERYALVSSNGGYDLMSPEDAQRGRIDWAKHTRAEFAYDAVKLADFTFQSVHRALPRGKDVIRAYYGSPPQRSYFQGSSMGGREAMMESQRYPNDFDGIVAGAPAGNIMGLLTQFNRIATAVRNPAGMLSPGKRTLLAKAVLAKCDATDGLADGVISNPARCQFDPAELRCSAGGDAGDSCLSDLQIDTVRLVTSPFKTSDGSVFHGGYNFGGEDLDKGWGEYIWPTEKFAGISAQAAFSDGFVRSFITRNPRFDTTRWNSNEWLPQLSLVGSMFQAFNPDLSGLQRRGAKILMWNGALDTSVSARDSSRYYDAVVETMGQDNTDQVLELFIMPGVGHGRGGPGPSELDWFKAMTDWVERGVPPSAQHLVIAKRDESGKLTMTRPVCKYPNYPRYRGRGAPGDAANFECVTQAKTN